MYYSLCYYITLDRTILYYVRPPDLRRGEHHGAPSVLIIVDTGITCSLAMALALLLLLLLLLLMGCYH